jgi:predicted nucleic acid-binding protein
VARSFLDTNILLYSDDAFDPRKNRIAVDLIAERRTRQEAVLSIQVLQEYFVNAVGKLKVEPIVARRKVELFAHFDLVVPDAAMVLAAIDLQRLNLLSFWDAMIIQAASVAGCEELISEDMQAGSTIAGVRIVNPFA